MSSYQDIVAPALDQLTAGLRPYIQKRMTSVYDDDWEEVARRSFRNSHTEIPDDFDDWDAHALLTLMWDQWNEVFRQKLGLFERSLVAELRAFRNKWAHQGSFSFDDTYRLLDSIQRLLTRMEVDGIGDISELKFNLLRDEFYEVINARALASENKRERWTATIVYAICGTVFVYLLPTTFGEALGNASYALSLSVALGFGYLIYLRFRHRPVQVGPHECRRCRRIIYGTSCPYCTGPGTFDSTEFRLGEFESADRVPTQPR